MKLSKYILIGAMLSLAGMPAVRAAEGYAPAAGVALADAPVVKVVSGHVEIDNPGNTPRHVDIYAITGQVVRQFDVQPGVTQIDLPAGCYIVRVDRYSVKIAVK